MKNFILGAVLSAALVTQTVKAGDREWAVAGKVLLIAGIISFFTTLLIFAIINISIIRSINIIWCCGIEPCLDQLLDLAVWLIQYFGTVYAILKVLQIKYVMHHWTNTDMMWFALTHIIVTGIIQLDWLLDFFLLAS